MSPICDFRNPRDLFKEGAVYRAELVSWKDIGSPTGRYVRFVFSVTSQVNTTETLLCNAPAESTNKGRLVGILDVLRGNDPSKAKVGVNELIGSVVGVTVKFKMHNENEIAVVDKVVQYVAEPKPKQDGEINSLLFGAH